MKNKFYSVELKSVITCPYCLNLQEEEMPTNACMHFWTCPKCHKTLSLKEGDCCVFCSYGSVLCLPVQVAQGERK